MIENQKTVFAKTLDQLIKDVKEFEDAGWQCGPTPPQFWHLEDGPVWYVTLIRKDNNG